MERFPHNHFHLLTTTVSSSIEFCKAQLSITMSYHGTTLSDLSSITAMTIDNYLVGQCGMSIFIFFPPYIVNIRNRKTKIQLKI